ncbi:hypothetical protein APR41_12050 [Salegentibacter salinarum]|uniref:Methyltransferase FkbM domain-containing protein n=1 Tax=Salegentibacter salinarum TaxID=447422 RepID=A0A2N0U2A8_9FLAO|nr:FkbM family methyltransferase [Salegentibacter salinarum]PKD21141.1 hypothetical protein APR41_12050 [Salegentibacter salinarum]SKB76375.1 methyltransferase, FkbM family [Salegentibacter salinarum]
MKNIIKKYTDRPGYKIVRKLSRRLGYDLIPLTIDKIGRDPYLDMKKFIINDHPVFFDVGANYGQTIDEITDVFKNHEIHSFEPGPDVFEYLKNKKSHKKNINIWNYGIGSAKSHLLLNQNTNRNMSSFLEIGNDGWGAIEGQTSVPVTTIDDFCKEQEIERIDVLKIDTQGFELEVFKGSKQSMQENRIGLLYFEVTFIDMYQNLPSFGELFDFAVENGFELITIYPIKYKNNRAGWTDVLFRHKNYNLTKN